MSFLIIIVLFVIAWVVLILPKQRELKRHNAFIQSLAVGDEVMTGSGIYGTLVDVSEAMVLLQVAPGVEIKIARRAIASQVVDPAVTETDVSGKTDDEDSDA
ncbi:MAG: preprotein translocase subunit YajC [Actinomycetia bacterium]|nr:preprotein translocase subunit YajC [Actinomycetes bacterium]